MLTYICVTLTELQAHRDAFIQNIDLCRTFILKRAKGFGKWYAVKHNCVT